MRSNLPFLSSLLAAAAPLAAQGARPLPAHAPQVDGHHAVSLPFGALYSLAAGAYLLTLYVRFSRGTFPWESFFPGTDPVGPALVGLVAWGVLVAFVAWQLREPRPPQHDPVPGATAARA